MNNWIKSLLIHLNGKGGGNVLDLACGNGGDVAKWSGVGVGGFVGVDVADKRLEEALRRVESFRNLRFKSYKFFMVDLGSESLSGSISQLSKTLPPKNTPHPTLPSTPWSLTPSNFKLTQKFTTVSCQLALHYMMQSSTRARNCFKTISENLEIGGKFILTTMDSRFVVERLMSLGGDLLDGKDRIINIGSENLCTIRVPGETVKRIFNVDEPLTRENWYGLKYNFELLDTLSPREVSVHLDEWLIPIELASCVMEEYGLVLEERLNFMEFFEKHKEEGGDKVRANCWTFFRRTNAL
ncbi:hypothetical protein TL16_g00351 [Triparma laevis f. inornata]|uniref:mRNA (guanine-N(7))-methyltransferase n=1 Tax=Triparma laevis f. inornata TaxID=1714386 RepID=A0A9W6ZAM3_9STRA|nr:hypothetical protein TL16_g00351 [Triparma laevis f. inornata]